MIAKSSLVPANLYASPVRPGDALHRCCAHLTSNPVGCALLFVLHVHLARQSFGHALVVHLYRVLAFLPYAHRVALPPWSILSTTGGVAVVGQLISELGISAHERRR